MRDELDDITLIESWAHGSYCQSVPLTDYVNLQQYCQRLELFLLGLLSETNDLTLESRIRELLS